MLVHLHHWITQKRVILINSVVLYLHLIHPSASSFFPKQCVSDTCNIPVAGVSARDLLLDLSLLTLSATCPLFLWGFYYKTAIAPLINTRYKFNPRSPDHCIRVVPWVFRHLSTLNEILYVSCILEQTSVFQMCRGGPCVKTRLTCWLLVYWRWNLQGFEWQCSPRKKSRVSIPLSLDPN